MIGKLKELVKYLYQNRSPKPPSICAENELIAFQNAVDARRKAMKMPLIKDEDSAIYGESSLYSRAEWEKAHQTKPAPTDAPGNYAYERTSNQKSEHRTLGGPVESEHTTIERLQRENASLRMRVTNVLAISFEMNSLYQHMQRLENQTRETQDRMQNYLDKLNQMNSEI